MWRWSWHFSNFIVKKFIFSTYVEVILIIMVIIQLKQHFLHVCGGDPMLCSITTNQAIIFSTYVEVIPAS